MVEKVAKKVGEAYAFVDALKDLYKKTPETLDIILGDGAKDLEEVTDLFIKRLEILCDASGMKETVLAKAERTKIKIVHMGDFYVGDDWDDTAEVLEWLSFFLGGALIHWQLIYGSADEMNNEDFKSIAKDGVAYFEKLLQISRLSAEHIGRERTK